MARYNKKRVEVTIMVQHNLTEPMQTFSASGWAKGMQQARQIKRAYPDSKVIIATEVTGE